MGIFDKSNYMVNTGIIEQFFVRSMWYQSDIVDEYDKTVDILWECGSQLVKYNMSHRMFRHHQKDVLV